MVREQLIRVVVFHHPVEKTNITVTDVSCRQQNLAQLKDRFARGQDVAVGLNQRRVNDELLTDTYPSAGSVVVFVPMAAGPTVGVIIAAVFWHVVVPVAIAYGLSYLGGKLFGQDVKQPSAVMEREESQSYGWNPVTTQRQGLPHPMSYGTNMHYGNVVARWTDVDGSGDEILYMILDYGRGPVQGKGGNVVYINDQPSTNYPGVTVQERLGTTDQTAMIGFDKNKLEYRPAWKITNDDGPATFVTPNNFFDDLEYTLEFPRGLFHFQSDGNTSSHSIGVKVEISEHNENDWTTLLETSVEGDQLSPIYKAYRANAQVADIVVHGKQYDLKVTKTSADKSIDKWGDELTLRCVREVVDVAFTRPGKALLGITALATERLSGHINVKWVADGKLVNVYDGMTWAVEFTRNRAWITLDMLTQPIISGDDGSAGPWTIERYEGLDPSRVDLAFFYEWAEWCSDQVVSGDSASPTEDRMPCDIIVDYQTDVWSLVYEISQVGRMYPYWQGNVLTGWVDKIVTGVTDLITFDNIMVRTWKSSWAGYGEMAGNAEIFFRDALRGYERESLPVPNENAGLYTRVVSIEGAGVTGRALANRVGNHVTQRNRLIKNVNSVRMYKDALRYKLGDVVRLQATVPDWGVSYRVVKSETDNTVELDRTCTASPGDIIYIRSYGGSSPEIEIDSYTVDSVSNKVVTIVETWDTTPVKGNLFAIGAVGDVKLRRIVRMSHAVDNYLDVELETYDETLFDSDDFEPYIDNPDYVWPQPAAMLVKPLTEQQIRHIVSTMLPPRPNIDIPWMSNLNWDDNSDGSVAWEKRDATEPILFRFRGVSYEIAPNSTTEEFIYWDPDFTTVFRHTNDASTALAVGNWLVCVNHAGVAYPANAVQLLHGAIIQAGTITAAKIIVSGINALDLTNAPAEAGANVTGGHTAADAASYTGVEISTGYTAAEVNAPSVGCKINYTSWGNANPGEIYFHGFNAAGVAADVNGWVYFKGSKVTLPKDYVNTNAAGKGYIVYDSAQTFDDTKHYGIIHWTAGAWKTLGGITITINNTVFAFGTAYLSTSELVDEAAIWMSPVGIRELTDFNADVTGDHQADIALANLGEKSLTSLDDKSLTNVDSSAATKLGGIETGADVTSGHEADIALANLGEKDVDSLVWGDYSKMPSDWRATDITKIEGGKIETDTILAGSISTYNLTAANATFEDLVVKTAYIDDLAVGTGQLADNATRILETAISDAWSSQKGQTWEDVVTDTIVSLGNPIKVLVSTEVAVYTQAPGTTSEPELRLVRGSGDGTVLKTWQHGILTFDERWSFTGTDLDVPGSGSQLYRLQLRKTDVLDDNVKSRFNLISLEESLGK